MSLTQSLQNAVVLLIPVAIYAIVVHWRFGLPWSEISARLGLSLGPGRPYLIALCVAALLSVVAASVSSWTSTFKGSMIAPFVGASPTPGIIAQAFNYGFLATGFPEELLFRGLIAGSLFRRLSFWKANLLQAAIFTLPHLLLLFVAPALWPLAIFLPLLIGLASGWLRRASGSIGPSVLLHAIPNIVGAVWVLNWRQFA